MRITFVGLGFEQLSVSLLAAMAHRDGHETRLVFSAALFDDRYNLSVPWLARLFDDRLEVLDDIERQRPDVLAFSALTHTYGWMLDIAREARQRLPDLKVVFGGIHSSAVPDEVISREEVDFVCVGEGDMAFPALLRALVEGGPTAPLPGILYRDRAGGVVRGQPSPLLEDLDSLPVFDKRMWEEYVRIGDFYMTMTSRGCPNRCSYCSNEFLAKLPGMGRRGWVRHRSPEHVLKELQAAKQRYRLKFISFEDDIFTVDKRWLHEFLDSYRREIGIPFQCLTHASYIDRDVAWWLKEAGCQVIQMGIETGDEGYRKRRLNRNDSDRHIEQALEAIRLAGLRLKVDVILGLPDEPEGSQEAAYRMLSRLPPDRVNVFWLNYLPGTELTRHACEQGWLDSSRMNQIRRGEILGLHDRTRIPGKLRKKYESYELLYRLLPLLPQSLRERLSANFIQNLPLTNMALPGIVLDLVNAARTRSREHLAYGLHYLVSSGRFTMRRLGVRSSLARLIHEDPG